MYGSNSFRESQQLLRYNYNFKAFEQDYTAWIDNAATKRHELLGENFSTRHGIPSTELLLIEAQKSPKIS